MSTTTSESRTSTQASDCVASAGTAETERLSRLFASEPELIRACLESSQPNRRFDGALVLAAARRALERRPRYADLHYFAAVAALQAGQLPQALSLLETALRLNPRYNDALILAARVCLLQEDRGQALTYLHRAILNGADYPDVRRMLDDLRQRLGDRGAGGSPAEAGSDTRTAGVSTVPGGGDELST